MWEFDLLDLESEAAGVSDGRSPKQLRTFTSILATRLGKVEFELLAVELGFVQFDAGTGGRLRGAEVYPDSPEALEQLESGVLVVDPKQGLEPLLQEIKNRGEGTDEKPFPTRKAKWFCCEKETLKHSIMTLSYDQQTACFGGLIEPITPQKLYFNICC